MVSNKLEIKKNNLLKALKSLESALRIAPDNSILIDDLNWEDEEDVELDLKRNGLLQKFEYTVELLWKTIQNDYKENGIIFDTPKEVLRSAFSKTNLSDQEKVQILKMIDHRNTIAHEYKDFIMKEIYPLIPNYFVLMKKLFTEFF